MGLGLVKLRNSCVSSAESVVQKAVGFGVLKQRVCHVEKLVLVRQFIMRVNIIAVRQKPLQILTGTRRRLVMQHPAT